MQPPTNASEDSNHSLPQRTRYFPARNHYYYHLVSILLLLHFFSLKRLFESWTSLEFMVLTLNILFLGSMEGRMGLLFLVVLGVAWACDARELANPGTSELSGKPDVCSLCQEYTTKALEYLNENKTQAEIIDILHGTCKQLRSFKQQCISFVDYYAPLFFLEVSSVEPEEFCHKVNLCQHIAYFSLQLQENSCGFCKDTVSAVLAKLKDPNTELEIIETLLKVCNSVEKYSNKCKRIVFEYGPLVFENAEKFLETTDICVALHACRASTVVGQQAFLSDS
ncbi:hypothetical protein VNO77_20721 [Canavalia gladiata]|uniref:Pulmonary surfactant-associated protein B n=1 Tax=Canavalia gladiata TaxID=3824 RepID=A0AAN9LT99_CANGL